MALLLYLRKSLGSNQWENYYWNTETKVATKTTFFSSNPSLTPFSYPRHTIIDVYQETEDKVAVISYNDLNNPSEIPLTSYPRLYLGRSYLFAAVGAIKLVKIRCLYPPPPSYPVTQVTVFRRPQNDVLVQNLHGPSPFCQAFELPEDTLLYQTCIGTTRKKWIYKGGAVVEEEFPNSVECGYVPPVDEINVTEVKRIKVDHSCYQNPVYLVWKNTLGGWDQWLFYKTQTNILNTEDIGEYQKPVWDIENANTLTDSLGKNAAKTLILGADNLTDNQKEAIREIMYSPKVYKVYKDGSKQVVRVKSGSWSSETKSLRHSIEFEIILPEIFTIKN